MSDYIKREDALGMHFSEGLHADMVLYVRYAEVKEHLQNVPSADVVEVVRCKDCKYLKPFTSQYGSGQYCECPCSFGGQGIKKPNDYCSYGERKYDDECK